MKKTLLVCSKSTRHLFPEYGRVKLVSSAPTISLLKEIDSEEDVIAVGGGAVIDTAKIISKNPITCCYPTTAAGACSTSWAVYWDNEKKHSVKRHRPAKREIVEKFLYDVPDTIIQESKFDAIAHCLDSLVSININNYSARYCVNGLNLLSGYPTKVHIVAAGIWAGDAIEVTGTNLLHALSYPMTSFYSISHGKALGYLLHKLAKELMGINVTHLIKENTKLDIDIDIDKIVDEAFTYSKINNTYLKIDKATIKKLLKIRL